MEGGGLRVEGGGWRVRERRPVLAAPRRVRPDRAVRILPERAFIISTVTAGARARDLLLPRITLISHNVLIEWFSEVKSPTK